MRTIWRLLAAGLLASLSAGQAFAQDFQPPTREESIPWGCWGITVLFLAAICVVAFKNAKRTHLD